MSCPASQPAPVTPPLGALFAAPSPGQRREEALWDVLAQIVATYPATHWDGAGALRPDLAVRFALMGHSIANPARRRTPCRH